MAEEYKSASKPLAVLFLKVCDKITAVNNAAATIAKTEDGPPSVFT
jgi:hypothetical protein